MQIDSVDRDDHALAFSLYQLADNDCGLRTDAQPFVMAAARAAITCSLHIRSGSVGARLQQPVRVVEEWSVAGLPVCQAH